MPTASPAPQPRAGNPAGLTVLRGFALLFIVLAHAAIPYMTEPPRGIAWPAREPGASPILDWIYLWCRACQPVFFVFSGMMAAAALQRQPPRAFLRDRWRMLGRPLLIAALTVLPVCYLIWMWGWWKTGYITVAQMLEFRLATHDKRDLLGFGHLWYLEYLLIYTAAYGVWCTWRGPPARTPPRTWPLAAAALGAWLLAWAYIDPAMITDFRNGFLPTWTYLAYNAGYFALGILLWQARTTLGTRPALWASLILAAQALAAAWLSLRESQPHASTLFMTLFSMLSALAWSCLGLSWVPRARPIAAPLRALARSGYWIYLVHLPVLGIATVLMHEQPLPAWTKLLIGFCVGVAIPFAAHRLVRQWAGRAAPTND